MIAFFFLVHPPVLKVTNSEQSEVGMTRLPNRKERLTSTLYRMDWKERRTFKKRRYDSPLFYQSGNNDLRLTKGENDHVSKRVRNDLTRTYGRSDPFPNQEGAFSRFAKEGGERSPAVSKEGRKDPRINFSFIRRYDLHLMKGTTSSDLISRPTFCQHYWTPSIPDASNGINPQSILQPCHVFNQCEAVKL